MSTQAQDNAADQVTSKVASIIDESVHRGADAVSNAAHQTAARVSKASDYARAKSQYLRDRASGVVELARQHPVYTFMAVGIIGVGLGFALRNGRGNSWPSSSE